MVFQSVTILVILVYVNYFAPKGRIEESAARYFRYFRDFCIGATLVVTVFSGLLYIQRAVTIYRRKDAT